MLASLPKMGVQTAMDCLKSKESHYNSEQNDILSNCLVCRWILTYHFICRSSFYAQRKLKEYILHCASVFSLKISHWNFQPHKFAHTQVIHTYTIIPFKHNRPCQSTNMNFLLVDLNKEKIVVGQEHRELGYFIYRIMICKYPSTYN